MSSSLISAGEIVKVLPAADVLTNAVFSPEVTPRLAGRSTRLPFE